MFTLGHSDTPSHVAHPPNAVVLAARALFTGAAIAAVGFAGAPARAQSGAAPESVTQRFDIPSGDLGTALSLAAASAGVQLSFDAALTRGRTTRGVSGTFTAEEAFARLLDGSGLQVANSGGNTYVLRANASQAAAQVLPAVKVTADADRLFDPPPERGGFEADFQQSATKTPLSIRETPQSISVITRDSMDARQARDLGSALELSAGVYATSGGGPFNGQPGFRRTGNSVFSRGQLLGEQDVRIDGFYSPSDVTTDTALFERIEVVKGPASTAYGPSSISGFIDQVSKRPQPVRQTTLTASGGSWNSFRGELDTTGPIANSDAIFGRLVVVQADSESFVDQIDSRRSLIAPSIEWRPGERTRVLLQTYYQSDSGRPNYGSPAVVAEGAAFAPGELRLPNIPRSRVLGNPEGRADVSQHQGLLRMDHEWSDRWLTTLVLQKARGHIEDRIESYAQGALYADGDVALSSNASDVDTDTWAGDLRLSGRFALFGHEHHLLAGVESRDVERIGGTRYSPNVGTINVYDNTIVETPEDEQTPSFFDFALGTDTRAAYAQLVLSVAERTRILAGLRHDRARARLGFAGEGFGQAFSGSTRSATTYRLGLSQDLTRNITAYTAYATSFVPVTSTGRDGSVLDPETGAGIEAGIKAEWLDGRFAIDLAVFQQDREDVPLALPPGACIAPVTSCNASSGVQRAEGVELELRGEPLRGLTTGIALAWTDAEYTERSDPNFGQTPQGSLERQSSAYLEYRIGSGALQGLGFGATVVSVGDRYQGLGLVGQYAKGYTRTDLKLSYHGFPAWEFDAQVRNLTDEKYIETVGYSLGGNFYAAPTALLFTARYRFD